MSIALSPCCPPRTLILSILQWPDAKGCQLLALWRVYAEILHRVLPGADILDADELLRIQWSSAKDVAEDVDADVVETLGAMYGEDMKVSMHTETASFARSSPTIVWRVIDFTLPLEPPADRPKSVQKVA